MPAGRRRTDTGSRSADRRPRRRTPRSYQTRSSGPSGQSAPRPARAEAASGCAAAMVCSCDGSSFFERRLRGRSPFGCEGRVSARQVSRLSRHGAPIHCRSHLVRSTCSHRSQRQALTPCARSSRRMCALTPAPAELSPQPSADHRPSIASSPRSIPTPLPSPSLIPHPPFHPHLLPPHTSTTPPPPTPPLHSPDAPAALSL